MIDLQSLMLSSDKVWANISIIQQRQSALFIVMVFTFLLVLFNYFQIRKLKGVLK